MKLTNPIKLTLCALALFGTIIVLSICNANEKECGDHDGHDHAKKEAKGCEGHDHAKKEVKECGDHDGHDHSKHEKKSAKKIDHENIWMPVEKKKDDHSGHDHSKKEAKGCDGHDGHDHAKHAEKDKKGKDEHSGHDHSKHAGEAEGGCGGHDEDLIELTEAQKKEINLALSEAGPGGLFKELMVPGEVVLNENRFVHLVSRVPGIVLEVYKSLGDEVKAGEKMAILDSAELGEAKSEYYERYNEVSCCKIDYDRAKIIEENTTRAIDDLLKLPSLAELKKNDYGDMGTYRSELLASYSNFLTEKKDHERMKKLYEKNVASESKYLAGQNDFDKAEAEFYAKLHDARFKIKQYFAEKKQDRRVSEFKLKTAERKLMIIGLSKEQIIKLRETTMLPPISVCTDPSCKGCGNDAKPKTAKDIENDNEFSQYIIRAPLTGTVTSKHISKGEKIDDNTEIFTIADLSKIWVDLRVSVRDIPLIKEGTDVIISSSSGMSVDAKVALVAPTINKRTRTVIVRLVIDNPKREWKPGMFVTGHIRLSGSRAGVALDSEAVQNIEGQDVVFIPSGHGFKAVPVVIGGRDRNNVQIISGIKPGDKYVSKGAFELKAVKVTSGAGAHAGHNH